MTSELDDEPNELNALTERILTFFPIAWIYDSYPYTPAKEKQLARVVRETADEIYNLGHEHGYQRAMDVLAAEA